MILLVSLWLFWTAPSDNVGVVEYDMRHSTDSATVAAWTGAAQLTGEPTPSTPGQTDSMLISGLAVGGTYFFALKSRDASFNWSELSNILSVNVPDTTKPDAAVDLRTVK